MITFLGKRELLVLLSFGLWPVSFCLDLFAPSFGVLGRLYYVIVSLLDTFSILYCKLKLYNRNSRNYVKNNRPCCKSSYDKEKIRVI